LFYAERDRQTKLLLSEWLGLILGSILVFIAFTLDYLRHMLKAFSFRELLRMKNPELIQHAQSYIPVKFPWFLFCAGILILISPIISYNIRMRRSRTT
jgi:surface polysaccharide O-acyltransferase-like enzyme